MEVELPYVIHTLNVNTKGGVTYKIESTNFIDSSFYVEDKLILCDKEVVLMLGDDEIFIIADVVITSDNDIHTMQPVLSCDQDLLQEIRAILEIEEEE